MSKIQDGTQLTGSSNISETMTHQNSNGYTYVFGVKLSGSVTSDFLGRQCVLEILDGSQITGSTNNFAGFADIHVVPKIIQGFMTTYETSKSLAIVADVTSCRKSKMTAN